MNAVAIIAMGQAEGPEPSGTVYHVNGANAGAKLCLHFPAMGRTGDVSQISWPWPGCGQRP